MLLGDAVQRMCLATNEIHLVCLGLGVGAIWMGQVNGLTRAGGRLDGIEQVLALPLVSGLCRRGTVHDVRGNGGERLWLVRVHFRAGDCGK